MPRRDWLCDASELAAVIVEPLVQGAAGMQLADPDGLDLLGAACRDHDVLLICDEVATGFGRTGTLFASEQCGLRPDLLCLGKGLTGGYLPMSATVASRRVFEAFLGPDLSEKTLYHGHSYSGNALAAAVALQLLPLPVAVVNTISPNTTRLTAALQFVPMSAPSKWLPLSIKPIQTAQALAAVAIGILSFWASRAVFSAGGSLVGTGNVTGNSTITVSGTHTLDGIQFRSGTTTLTGGTVVLTGAAIITQSRYPSPTVGGGGTINYRGVWWWPPPGVADLDASIPDKLGEKMAAPRARFFARSAWNPSALPPMRAQSVARSHRFLLHHVKQRTRLR